MIANTIKAKQVQPHLPELLDFCKGIAIIGVFLFHYHGGWLGWQGVHIFIVLSGFGLTYSCLKQTKTISWKLWYRKRAERILPTYWLLIAIGFFLTLLLLFLHIKHNLTLNDLVFRTTLYLLLLNVFSFQSVEPFPNYQLWFIPFIVSFYLIFPYLYRLLTRQSVLLNRQRDLNHYLCFLLGTIAIEITYRFIAVYYLDGIPIAVDGGSGLAPVTTVPLHKLPLDFPFKGEAPFGLCFARLGEFGLGMVGAAILMHGENQKKLHQLLLNPFVAGIGLLIWVLGDALLYAGLWGWVFADLVIALGLNLFMINLSARCQRGFPGIFSRLSRVGVWSYYIYLTHAIIMIIFLSVQHRIAINASSVLSGVIKLGIFCLIVIGTAIASWLVMKFDTSILNPFLRPQEHKKN